MIELTLCLRLEIWAVVGVIVCGEHAVTEGVF